MAAECKQEDKISKYGSVNARLRSLHPWRGGSALSVMVTFDDSQKVSVVIRKASRHSLDTTTASGLLKEGFSFQSSSSVSKKNSPGVSICSHAGTDPFKSSDQTRVSSQVEFNIDLAKTGEARLSILDRGEWDRNITGSYILTPISIGPYFTTSSRFLTARYLKEGKLSDIVNKMFLEAPRMLMPLFIISVLEYFLVDQGLTGALQYCSTDHWISWST